jgi:hypothetical protein
LSRIHPEKKHEKAFCKWIDAIGGVHAKQAMVGSYGKAGLNDRVVWLPWRVVIMFEFKRTGVKKADKLQQYRHKKFKEIGHRSHVVWTFKEAQEITRHILYSEAVSKDKHSFWRSKTGRRFLSRAGIGEDFHRSLYLQDSEIVRSR